MGTKIQWSKNNDFVKYLINSKKNSNKCKIWSQRTFYYGDHIEQFGSTVWTLKTLKMDGVIWCYQKMV